MNTNYYDFDFFNDYVIDDLPKSKRILSYNTIKSFSNIEGNFYHTSFERIPIKRALALIDYLEYEIVSLKYQETDKHLELMEWYSKALSGLYNVLNFENSRSFVTSDYVYNRVNYTPANVFKISDTKFFELGRLYGRQSIQVLPKEVRKFIFGSENVTDFDIVNSHPSILLDYAIKNKIRCEQLQQYVRNRNLYLQEIVHNDNSISSISDAKQLVLIIINLSEYNGKHNKFLMELHLEVKAIREHLWHSCYSKEGYSHFLTQKILKDKKVSLQSIYCQTQETIHVLNFIKFLEKKWVDYLNSNSNLNDEDMYRMYFKTASKKLELQKKDYLITVPFFDGVLVDSLYPVPHLQSLCFEYNDSNKSNVKFETKSLDYEYKKINIDLLNRIHTISFSLSNATSSQWRKIINLIEFPSDTLLENLEEITSDSLENIMRKRKYYMYKCIISLNLPLTFSLHDLITELEKL